ncbi:MAG: Acetyltransferase [uncultured Thermomicrobiales bacterium]|uniref:Acetyltransferase n=1 Tax=uncultured Thermomicrobiales bacterium TaxID=1645740 RepID=A0A6J4UYV6_9BACT|nr:MAG: Acetyltransferase [uncultured Thermomicrobiales bacterium]
MIEPTYPIRTERLRLRPYAAGDFDDLFAMHSREDVVRHLYWDVRDREEVAAMLERRMTMTVLDKEGDALVLAVELPETGQVIGDALLHWTSEEHRQGEIGFVFHPDFHGRGYASEAAMVMLRLGFEELGLHRIAGRCEAGNVASARLMERLGMRREAHFRENEFVKGRWDDELVFAMLEQEWAAHH